MKTTKTDIKYVEWLSAEVMHKNSIEWLSELRFINNALLFFDDLIKSYTLQLIDTKHFDESKKVVDKLGTSHKKTNYLIKIIQVHQNDLKIMIDGFDQKKEEEENKNEHRKFIIMNNEFLKTYRIVKTEICDLIKNSLKEQKQKRLLQ